MLPILQVGRIPEAVTVEELQAELEGAGLEVCMDTPSMLAQRSLPPYPPDSVSAKYHHNSVN